MKAYTKKDVILSAGTIQSPTVLMRSGIGPADHLKEHDIPVKADLPVGEYYIDHFFVHFEFSFKVPVDVETFDFDAMYQYVFQHTGHLYSVPYMAGYLDTTNTTGLPDIQQFFTNFPEGTPPSLIQQFNTFTNFPQLNDPLLNAMK